MSSNAAVVDQTLQPSPMAMVPFVSVDNMMKVVNTIGLPEVLREMGSYIQDLSLIHI